MTTKATCTTPPNPSTTGRADPAGRRRRDTPTLDHHLDRFVHHFVDRPVDRFVAALGRIGAGRHPFAALVQWRSGLPMAVRDVRR